MSPDAVAELLVTLRESLRVPDPPSTDAALAEHGLWVRGLNDYMDGQVDDLIDVVAQRWTRTDLLPAPAKIREWMGERAATRYGHTRQEPEGCGVCGDTGAPWYAGPGRVSLPLPTATQAMRFPVWFKGELEPWTVQEVVLPCQCKEPRVTLRRILERWRAEVADAHRQHVRRLEHDAQPGRKVVPIERPSAWLREAATVEVERGAAQPMRGMWLFAKAQLDRVEQANARLGGHRSTARDVGEWG